MAAGSGLWGCAGAAHPQRGTVALGDAQDWQQTLHTSAGLDLEMGFEREGRKKRAANCSNERRIDGSVG